MIQCPECGRELPDGTRYCPSCGQPCNRIALKVQQRVQLDAAQTLPAEDSFRQNAPNRMRSSDERVRPAVPSQARAAGSKTASSGSSKDPRSGKKGIIALVIAALLVCAAVAGMVLKSSSDKRAEEDMKQSDKQVVVAVDAPGYEKGVDSPIPFRVVGADLDGVQVDEIRYILPDNPSIMLKQGNYSISVAASPLLMKGAMYLVPDDVVEVQLRDESLSGGDLSWSFTEMNPADITDEMLDEAYGYAADAGMESGRAEALRDAVVSARQAALDDQADAERAESGQKAAEAQQREYDDGRTYQDEFVTLQVPGDWVGQCVGAVAYDGGMFQTDFVIPGGSFVLLSVSGVPGDLSTYGVSYLNSATEIWDSEHGSGSFGSDELDRALFLQTGGQLTRADVLACSDGYEAQALGESYIGPYLESIIGPTISAS